MIDCSKQFRKKAKLTKSVNKKCATNLFKQVYQYNSIIFKIINKREIEKDKKGNIMEKFKIKNITYSKQKVEFRVNDSSVQYLGKVVEYEEEAK